MKTKLLQKDKVLRHLKEIGPITPLDAFNDYAIMRLTSKICELKDEGYNISTTILKSENKFGEPVSYAQYKIENEAN